MSCSLFGAESAEAATLLDPFDEVKPPGRGTQVRLHRMLGKGPAANPGLTKRSRGRRCDLAINP